MTYLFTLVIFSWGVITTPVSISLAQKFRLLDKPGGRKKHNFVMPRGAGIVLWSGYLLWALFNGNSGVEVPYVATGATFVFIIGYMDDMHPLPPLLRLIFHLISALWITTPLPVPIWQRALLSVWIAGVTNAYNMIDGMDGLCLSMTLITCIASAIFGNINLWLPIAGLVFGVLLWNFPSPRTFLGDGGSTLLGYVCASHISWGIFSEVYNMNIIFLSLILVLLGGVPVLDTLVAMTRRVLTGKSPFLPDRGHAHHKLQDFGLSKITTLLLLISIHFFILFLGYTLLEKKFFI
ncbi:MAG: MraY family glycosyltransferase [Synergistaceae bacterium]